MGTIRGVKNRRANFTQVLNVMLEDSNLTLKAKGFITYCLKEKEDFTFYLWQLSSALKEGDRAIYSTLDECVEHGYAIRYQPRKPNGDFAEWETIVSDCKEEISLLKEELKQDPHFQKFFTERRFAGPRDARAQNVEAQSTGENEGIHNNTDNNNTKKQQQQQEAAPPAPPVSVVVPSKNQEKGRPDFIYNCLIKVDIPIEEKIWISKSYSEEVIKNAIDYTELNKDKIRTSYTAYLKMSCQKGLKIAAAPIDKSEANRSYSLKYDGLSNAIAIVNVLSSHVEVAYTGTKLPTIIKFTDHGFKDQLDSTLRKCNFQVKNE